MKLFVVFSIFLVALVAQLALAEISAKQKEQITNGLKGAAQLMKFLQEKNFFSVLTKVSAVAGPLFSVAMVVLNIAFMFIDIESAEMKLMKEEFGKLNNRLDSWGVEFGEIKRKIDWSAVQVSYGDIERSIRTLRVDLDLIVNSKTNDRESQRQYFITRYESSFLKSAEELYSAMVNTENSFSENLFRASQRYTENHRGAVQQFMVGTFQLLMQGIEVQASYITMKYNSTSATNFIQNLWDKKLKVLQERMKQMDIETKNKWADQMPIDADNLLKRLHGQSNQAFTTAAVNFFKEKYDWRYWFVITYNEISGWDNHAVSLCGGVIKFRTNGRNFVMASTDKTYRDSNGASRAQAIIDEYSRKRVIVHNKDYARRVMSDLSNMHPGCSPFVMKAAVQWGGGVWYWSNGGYVGYKKICVFSRNMHQHCFNTFLFG